MSEFRSIDHEILDIYAQAQKKGKKLTMPKVCSKLPYSKVEVSERIKALRDGGFLAGGRAFQVTSTGFDALKALEAPVELVESTPVETLPTIERRKASLSESLASEYMVDADQLWRVISRNVIRVKSTEPAPTPEEVMLVMSTCNTYNLNPFVNHIYAFRSKGKLVTPVGYDGWVHMANSNPRFQGVKYEYPNPDQMIERFDKQCFPWIKATCYIEGRFPVEIVVFLDEWSHTDNWRDHPNHRLRMKAYTSSIREALGISLPDDIDAELIQFNDMMAGDKAKRATRDTTETLLSQMGKIPGQLSGRLSGDPGPVPLKFCEPTVSVPDMPDLPDNPEHPINQDPPLTEEPPEEGENE
ncbi:MAG: hypothetical protein DRN03_06645 [Thermoplasmata archaeon]|nr:MAG: hypothetical protein DRN03_06645 [Thermoplasmata archaeon]